MMKLNSTIETTKVLARQSVDYLKDKYRSVRLKTLQLCEPLTTEDFVVQPVEFVSPPKWNLAHVTWFFETLILKAFDKNYREFNADYPYFFNSYYESLGKRVLRMERGNMTRPTTEEIYAYRKYVDEHFLHFLDKMPEIDKELFDLIELGLNHEQQHQELLLTDLKYILGHNPLFPVYLTANKDFSSNGSGTKKESFIEIEEGIYQIGYEGEGFYFDNEKGAHQVFLHAYRLSEKLVSNAEYLEFMEAGGYKEFSYWLSAGWDWVKSHQIKAPMYWHCIEGQWQEFTLNGLQKVNMLAPVTHISLYEADAYARWKGKRLATEFEWEVACKKMQTSVPKEANFLENNNFHPSYAHRHSQMYGDVWEWTNSAYLPYPYFKQAKGAVGEYNGKFMMNQMVLRGGSCITPRDHIRSTYRNFFYPQERWQFTGIRLAEYV